VTGHVLCLQPGNTTHVPSHIRPPGKDQGITTAPALSESVRKDLRRLVRPRGIVVEYATTADMSDGQALPPLIENGVVWHIVRRSDGHPYWRRIIRAEDRREVHGPTAHPQSKGKGP
jgi:hypothetical protein